MARRSTPKGHQQKSFCRRSCFVCVEQHILHADRSWGRPVWTVSWMSEARYDGVCPANDLWTRYASLNSTLGRTGSQCNFCMTGVMRSHRRVPVIRRAAAFCTGWTLRVEVSECGRGAPDSLSPSLRGSGQCPQKSSKYHVEVCVRRCALWQCFTYCGIIDRTAEQAMGRLVVGHWVAWGTF